MRQRRATQHSVFKVTVARCDLCGRFTLRGLLMKCVPVAVPPCTAVRLRCLKREASTDLFGAVQSAASLSVPVSHTLKLLRRLL